MATAFVAPVLPKAQQFAVVHSYRDAGHACRPFGDGVALIAWTGKDISPALLETIPTEDMLLGVNPDRAVGIFAKMLYDVLEASGLLCRIPGGDLMMDEVIFATREAVWRIDQAGECHKGSFACIGDGARSAEPLYGKFLNSYKGDTMQGRLLHALHWAREFDKRAHGGYAYYLVTVNPPSSETRPDTRGEYARNGIRTIS